MSFAADEQWRDWDLSLGPVSGSAGEVKTVTVTPQCLFRVEKVMASDTGGGSATRIMSFYVGNRLQRPALAGATLAQFFGSGVLGNGVRWDTCERGLTISATVSFVEAATFEAALFGKAVT